MAKAHFFVALIVTLSTAFPVSSAAIPTEEESPSSIVRAAGVERIPFVFRVGTGGLFFLVFSVPVPQEEKEIAEKLGFKYGANWVGKKFIVVE